jgi:phage-related protein
VDPPVTPRRVLSREPHLQLESVGGLAGTVLAKVEATSRTEAAAIARRHSLLDPVDFCAGDPDLADRTQWSVSRMPST